MNTKIPCLNLGRAPDSPAPDRSRIASELHQALQQFGAVHLRHHGIAARVIDEAFVEVSKACIGPVMLLLISVPRAGNFST